MKLTNKQQQRLQHAFYLHESGQLDAAVDVYRGLLRAIPTSIVVLSNLGMAMLQSRRLDEGLPFLERSLRIDPGQAAVWAACAMAYVEKGDGAAALNACQKALEIETDNFAAYHAQGLAFHMLQQYESALASYLQTLVLAPDHIEALCNLGLTQIELGQFGKALQSFDQALQRDPFYLPAIRNRLRLLRRLGRYDEAIQFSEKLCELMPSSSDVQYEYAMILEVADKRESALAAYKKTLDAQPRNVDAWCGVARVAKDLKRLDEALSAYKRAFELNSTKPFLVSDLLGASLDSCDWSSYRELLNSLNDVALDSGTALRPFDTLRLPVSRAQQLSAARHWITVELAGSPNPRQFSPTGPKGKLRVGVATSDLRDHPVSFLLEVFLPEIDRSKIQLVGLPTANKNVAEHRQLMFDEWHDLSVLTGEAAISRLLELNLDVILNLNGITLGERSELFATRVAPIQVSFLGYAGTLGAHFIDYLIADSFVVPKETEEDYFEKIAYMPDTFFIPNIAAIADVEISRYEEGLPPEGMVFCCFNNSYKITPDIFDIWMRLLQQVPNSVLWLSASNEMVVRNLKMEAQQRGVEADRLVFARFRESRAEHLRRIQLADLFLDTFYYNAHTTASDALWAGVPVLTCPGETFASRVAGSLLKAAGMDDLIVGSREAYEAKALQLATDPGLLAETRAKLARNKESYPIFDMPRYARNFERLLWAMWERYERGLPPAPLHLEQKATD